MRVVAHEVHVLEAIAEHVLGLGQLQLRVGARLTGELQLHLLAVVVVDVAVPTGPDELADLQARLLGEHVGQQRVAGDVEGHAQEHVGAALIELAGELPISHVQLEQQVAGWQGHVLQLGDVPRADDVPAGIRVLLQQLQCLGDLVDVVAIRGGPAAPLHAVDRAQVAVLIGPLVPDADAVILQPPDVGIPGEEPQQLADHGLHVHGLRRNQWEGLRQIKADLLSEQGRRAGAGAVVLLGALREDLGEQILVGRGDGGGRLSL